MGITELPLTFLADRPIEAGPIAAMMIHLGARLKSS
jgi:hypothetical protein